MPNVKFYVDAAHCPPAREALARMLPGLRDILCERLGVERAACQFAVIEVAGMEDQAAVNIELMLLPRPSRTPDTLRAVAEYLRAAVAQASGLHAAVRMVSLDPQTYLTLK